MRKHLTASENAKARFAKREAIMAPRQPIRLSRYGLFIVGIITGVLITGLVAFVMNTTGTIAGVMLIFGIAMILFVIGINMKGVDE